MKKYVILLIAWAITGLMTFASGGVKGGNMIVKIEKGNIPGKVVVRLANLEKQSTQIAVQSVDGTIWFSKYIRRKSGFATNLDLRSIPDGDYVLFVRNERSKWAQVFSMNAGDEIAFLGKPTQQNDGARLIARFNVADDMMLGAQLANLQRRPAVMHISTLGREQLFSDTIRGKDGFATLFNMKGATDDDYFVYVKGVDATVVQFFAVEGTHLLLGEIQRLDRPKEIVIPEEEVEVQ